MKTSYKNDYLTTTELRKRAKSKIPKFIFQYLDGGCNDNINLAKNIKELGDIELKPIYITEHKEADLKTELFGHTYDAPFGIAPMGLQGFMWPNAPEILAKSAGEYNIPFLISTLTTCTIERMNELAGGRAWFQLYHPKEPELRDKLLKKVEGAGCPVLVLIVDMPTKGYRPWDVRNGFDMPPEISIRNILQMMAKPEWVLKTIYHGRPTFAIMKSFKDAADGHFYFDHKLDEKKIAEIRNKWKGKLVIKGVSSEEDTETAIKLGADGIIVSNHGGRQLDVGQSSIATLGPIVKKYEGKIKIMMDSGMRTGPDIARSLASGAEFTFLGRNFMYAVAALGTHGGEHMIRSLKTQLKQVMEQISCVQVSDLKNHLVKRD
ncbi:MAG: alpha-hydroxy-acid oxidizing protein [Bacteroidetes bacterium]|jgi:L-lactate dehydrogenase (cytochrome)|nr:alpha-hydroxy-acid oxidizing protein [Bacteroidota bacterium]